MQSLHRTRSSRCRFLRDKSLEIDNRFRGLKQEADTNAADLQDSDIKLKADEEAMLSKVKKLQADLTGEREKLRHMKPSAVKPPPRSFIGKLGSQVRIGMNKLKILLRKPEEIAQLVPDMLKVENMQQVLVERIMNRQQRFSDDVTESARACSCYSVRSYCNSSFNIMDVQIWLFNFGCASAVDIVLGIFQGCSGQETALRACLG